ncbi:hypothetical protein CASFOL_040136 [Castilleja foliolosa]|uniref:GOLD domain-containing protein n=1 Tax=Castilleja foliolosa TaxID=1961234 RepID=A0ABD3BGB3_9LAMI
MEMASTEGLVPITRAFLSSYYDKYPFAPLSNDVSRLSDQIHSMAADLLKVSPPTQGESLLVQEAECQPPHKVDENMWKNREQLEEIIFLLEPSNWPRELTVDDAELASVLGRLQEKLKSTLKTLENFQAKNSEFIFNTVMSYMPQDFRGTIIRQQRERSERNKQAAIDTLMNSGGSIHDKYALLWKQQMERRRQLAELGSATGVYKTLIKYLVGVPEVLMEFVRQINDDQGPMEEQRQRYGPPLYSLTRMAQNIRLFVSLLWGRVQIRKLEDHQISIIEEVTNVYTSEFERFIDFIGEVFMNSPFFISAEDAGTLTARKSDEYKEISVSAGETHEVTLTVEPVNSYIAWDFSLAQGKMSVDIGFSVECTDQSGKKTVLRYKVDCIPPVVESESVSTADQ